MAKTKNVRGASYPVINLEKAIDFTHKILKMVGKASTSKLDIARATGYSGLNGQSRRIIAALGQYELIVGRGEDYKLSPLALDILFPDSETAKRQSIIFAAQSPSLFKQLIEVYEGESVPGLLPNILVSKYSINPKFGNDVARIFKSTLDFAGLIDDNGLIFSGTEYKDEASEEGSEGLTEDITALHTDPSDVPSLNTESTLRGDNLNKIEIILREGVKAGIYAPHNLTQEEKTKLKSIIDLL